MRGVSIDPLLYPVRHLACRGVAFVYDHRPRRGEAMSARNARHVDGRTIHSGEPFRCDACGESMTTGKVIPESWADDD